MKKTLHILFPLPLLLMVFFVQIVSLLCNFTIYNVQPLLVILAWTPLVMLPYFLTEKRIFYQIALTIFFIGNLLNLCHILILRCPINASSLFIVLNTNFSEAKEFIGLKFHFIQLLLIPYIAIYIWGMRKKEFFVSSKKSKILLCLVLLFSTVYIGETILNSRFLRKGIPPTAKAFVAFVQEAKSYSALKKRTVMPVYAQLISNATDPHLFVLIIGESCNRNHLSLYNYHRKTTPLLEQRKEIIYFNNVISPCSNTLYSLLTSLTESDLENQKEFDKSISLIDIFHAAGFKTYWLSNQSPIGIWDNAVYNIAQTTDCPIFVNRHGNTSFENTYISSYDEHLFQPLHTVLEDTFPKKFIIIHLMGSHSKYAKRYPPQYAKFQSFSSKKEKIINEYDNSILYNDFIIDGLFNILADYCSKHAKTISSALYFADHGENVYDENDQVGHTYSDILPKANVEIPFIVWLSPRFLSLYPQKQEVMLNNREHPFVSDDLFHAVIDLNNIDCNLFIKERSLFHSKFNFERKRILEDGHDYDLR